MKIAICFGTRPEIIKLCLLSKKLQETHQVLNVFTGQHHSLYEDVKHLIDKIDYTIPLGEFRNITGLYAELTKELGLCFEKIKPDLVIVQGDTASSYIAALCAFLNGIKVGHVEAGLRTFDLQSPFPEEFNRLAISKIAKYHWCPSEIAVSNLQKECVDGKIILSGNTIVDFVNTLCDTSNISYNNEIIVTLHRRENSSSFEKILSQLNYIASSYPDLKFVFPVHPNPSIKGKVSILTESNIVVCDPMKYEEFVHVLKDCKGIISDSGGIQEEAVCLRKKLLICRNNTERPEGINCGVCKLVGSNVIDNFEWLLQPLSHTYINPYGDGNTCEKIVNSL